MVNAEYVKQTMRGGSEITVNEHDLYGTESQTNTIDGLDADYASEWSYGKAETMTLLVPGFYGGSSDELYWGEQRFTNGTVYIGAIIVFLFLLGLLIVKEQERWWLIATAIIGILLAWGSNFQWFNVLLRNYLPMYNKFRSPSMSLVIVSVSAVIMALLALRQIFNDTDRVVIAID